MVDRRRERRLPERSRVQIKKQMVHTRIADKYHVDDIGPADACLLRCPGSEFVQRFDDSVMDLFEPPVAPGGITDTGHDIFPESHLRVHHRMRRHDFTCLQVAEITGHGCRPDIYGQSVSRFRDTRFYPDDFTVFPERDGYLPVSLPDCFLKAFQYLIVYGQAVELAYHPEFFDDALEISRGVMERGGFEFEIAFGDGGVQGYLSLGSFFTDDLVALPALFRYENHEVAVNPGLTGQAVPLLHLVGRDKMMIALFVGLRGSYGGCNVIFGEIAFFDSYPAFTADTVAAADIFNARTEFPARIQYRGTFFYLAAQTGRLKNNRI